MGAVAVEQVVDRGRDIERIDRMVVGLAGRAHIRRGSPASPAPNAGMGFGVPGGIGVAAATGRRPLILVGDGAMQMNRLELGNCRRYGLDPIVVLFNNASWEMLRAFQPESHFNDLDDWNYAAIAPSLGGYGERV